MSAFLLPEDRLCRVSRAEFCSGKIRSETEGAEKDTAAVIHLPVSTYSDLSLSLPFVVSKKKKKTFKNASSGLVGNKSPTVLMHFNQPVLQVLFF